VDGRWIGVVIIAEIGVIITIALVASVMRTSAKAVANKRIALADAENSRRYQELVELCSTGQRQTAEELAKLTERVAAIEKLLRDVG
jgi:hypothetical protein